MTLIPDYQSWDSLLSWSQEQYHFLPWRTERSIYGTLISELMLQQTTVAVVKQRWPEFMQRFPSWEDLHQASLDELLSAWQGLGYYQRARNLHKLTQMYQSENLFLEDLLAGLKQPGVGPYTKGALLSIGLNQQAHALDANLNRVLARIYGADFHASYDLLLQHYQPRLLNEALMDLGRTLCQARQARCGDCFFQKSCQSSGHLELQEPLKKQSREVLHLARLYCAVGDQVLGIQKKEGQWLAGYIELPTFVISGDCPQYQPAADLGFNVRQEPDWSFVSQITKYRIVNAVYVMGLEQARELLGDHESYYDFYAPSTLWATSSQRVLKHFKNYALALS